MADEDFGSLEILNPIIPGDAVTDKACILDIRLRTRSGNPIDIEMQVCNHAGLWERIAVFLPTLCQPGGEGG